MFEMDLSTFFCSRNPLATRNKEGKRASEREKERAAANFTDLIAYSSDSNNENETFQVCVKYRSARLAMHSLDGDGDFDNERSS